MAILSEKECEKLRASGLALPVHGAPVIVEDLLDTLDALRAELAEALQYQGRQEVLSTNLITALRTEMESRRADAERLAEMLLHYLDRAERAEQFIADMIPLRLRAERAEAFIRDCASGAPTKVAMRDAARSFLEALTTPAPDGEKEKP